MASALTKRALQTVGDSGFGRAKKLADLTLKTNTDASGGYTAAGYEQAISILQPFIGSGKESEALDAQRLIASYSNNLTKIQSKQKDQNETVAAFKLQENDAYFTSFDGDVGGFRNPGDLVNASSQALDNLVLGVINAIDEKEVNGDSTDSLYTYLNELQKRADTMRDLNNRYENGELGDGQVLDGFGYYVDTNPIDGSIRGAALLPVGQTPEGITAGYRRLDATTKLGGSNLPVYAPAQRDSTGQYVSRIGGNTWSGTGDGALSSDKGSWSEGSFNISDSTLYPVKTSKIDKGQFGIGLIGRDEQGNPVEGMFYRGVDDKLYSVDNQTLEGFRQDPILAAKLDGYIPRFSPTEMKDLSSQAVPFTTDRLGRESKIAGFQSEAAIAQAEADKWQNMGFFQKVNEGFKSLTGGLDVGGAVKEAAIQATPVAGGVVNAGRAIEKANSFFANRTNKPNTPDEAPASGGNDIIEKGKSFFRKVGDAVGL